MSQRKQNLDCQSNSIVSILGKRVCVQVEKFEERQSKHGFILPAEEKAFFRGVILHVGDGIKGEDSISVREGMRVYFSKGNEIELETDIYIVPQEDILAIIASSTTASSSVGMIH